MYWEGHAAVTMCFCWTVLADMRWFINKENLDCKHTVDTQSHWLTLPQKASCSNLWSSYFCLNSLDWAAMITALGNVELCTFRIWIAFLILLQRPKTIVWIAKYTCQLMWIYNQNRNSLIRFGNITAAVNRVSFLQWNLTLKLKRVMVY